MVTDNPNLISRKAMEAMQNTGGSGEPLLSEILQKVNNAKDKPKKIEVLRQYDSDALRMIIKGAFDPNIKWALPEGRPPFMENDVPKGTQHSQLKNESKRLWHFIEGADIKTSKTQKETIKEEKQDVKDARKSGRDSVKDAKKQKRINILKEKKDVADAKGRTRRSKRLERRIERKETGITRREQRQRDKEQENSSPATMKKESMAKMKKAPSKFNAKLKAASAAGKLSGKFKEAVDASPATMKKAEGQNPSKEMDKMKRTEKIKKSSKSLKDAKIKSKVQKKVGGKRGAKPTMQQ